MHIQPSFIIHSSSSPDRDDVVKMLQEKTGAEVIEAVWIPNDPKKGCRESHKKVAALAKEKYPDSSYLVFEDDCELVSDRWFWPTVAGDTVDLIYLGVNGYGTFFGDMYSYGTHAMIVNPKMRDLILDKTDEYVDRVWEKGAFDHILNKLCYDNDMTVWRPTEKDKERWVRQKKGLTSTITGNIR